MRRLSSTTSALLCAAILATACNSRKPAQVETVEEESSQITSVVHVADPRASVQLLKGFHDVEGNSWRWTKSAFSVTLKPLLDAATKGATLEMKLAVPDALLSKVGSTTLRASINGAALEPETYTKAGDQVYKRDVPAAALTGDAVTIDFALDKFLAAGAVEQRELGVIVSTIGLMSK